MRHSQGLTAGRLFSSLALGLLVVSAGACRPDDNAANGLKSASGGLTSQQIVNAFQRFHADTGAWPFGNGILDVKTGAQLDPIQFSAQDTALFQLPANMKQCSATESHPCWNGPYLTTGKSLGDADWKDQFGHAFYGMVMRPRDGQGGGSSVAPDGLVAIWSAGKDGKDGFGCSDASCARNWLRVGKGLASDTNADDVVSVVGVAR